MYKMDSSRVCRICLQESANMKSLLSGAEEINCLQIMFESLTRSKFEVTEETPYHLCRICEYGLTSSYNFQKLCLQSNENVKHLKITSQSIKRESEDNSVCLHVNVNESGVVKLEPEELREDEDEDEDLNDVAMSDSKFDFTQSSQSEEEEETEEVFKEEWNAMVPKKSCTVYKASYQRFIKWCKHKNVTFYSESVLLAYFSELKTKMKSSTMWSHYSMIKSILNLKQGIDISKYLQLRAYLKTQNIGYSPKKSRVFTREQIEQFISEAPDKKYLGLKMVLIMGVSGGCRCDEMVKMKIDDIEDLGKLLHVTIRDSVTNKQRAFTVLGEVYINIYRRYLALRPSDMPDGRFFVKYKNGKCHRSVMGVHKIGSVPREVASYLHLPDWEDYTGRSMRGTSVKLS